MRNILLLLGLALATQSHAKDLERTPIPPIMYDNVIRTLMTEVTTMSGLPLPAEEPRVYLTSRHSIEENYCNESRKDCHVAAITDDETGEIYLSPVLLQINVLTASVIFHELVHWAQVKNHTFANEPDCFHWAKSEMHAYTAQSKFLEKHTGQGFEVPNLLDQCK